MTTGSSNSTEELLKRLAAQHQAYLETFKLVHESLLSSKNNTNSYFNSNSGSGNSIQPPSSPVSPTIKKLRRSTHDTIDTSGDRISLLAGKSPTFHSSIITGEDSSSSDDDEDLYVQEPLPAYKYDLEDLKSHLKSWRFNEEGKLLLDSVVVNGRLKNPALFGDGDRQGGVGSHYSVYDVANDGSPLSRHEVVKAGTESIDDAIWQAIRDLNADPAKERKAVGRISIIREPAPVIFGALHLTMNEHFDMDELFSYLVSDSDKATTQAHMSQSRAFMPDHRRQRSFVFSFEYFTIIGEDCKPMPWQLSNPSPDPSNKLHHSGDHIPISRCSSIVALSLTGSPIRRLKNVSRRKKTMHGHVYDPWAPWHVLNFQCYPDLKHSMDSHDSTKHYVNGPEAFLHTLLAEFKDAQKRFEEIYLRITKLVTPPADFMFNSRLRDKLLFEDAQFTYSRRYFWAFQTLGIINNNIKSMIDSYEDTFTEDVWLGKHKYLWPMVEEDSARNVYWRKRMATLKRDFEREIQALRIISEENNERRKEIRTLRDQLFSGTSVLESRKSVEMASITIQQGHNIKLLTLVSIFFLPLTFVTSVFGMTNMPTEHQFYSFGIVMATVCIPFFLLIGSLNTTQGMEFWIGKWHRLVSIVTRKPIPTGNQDGDDVFSVKSAGDGGKVKKRERSLSQLEALARRKRRIGSVVSVESEAGTGSGSGSGSGSGMGNTPSTSFGRGDGEGNNGNGANSGDQEKDNNGVRNKEGPSPPSLASMSAQITEGEGRWSILREKFLGRKKRDREVELEHV